MTSDDLTAGAAIAFGTLLSVALTARVVMVDPAPVVIVAPVTISRPAPLVDFAIIRSEAELMVGPEGPHSGWQPSAIPAIPVR